MAAGGSGDDQESHSARVAALESLLAERDAQLTERDAQLTEQSAQLTEQAAQIAALTEQVAKLTELLNQNSKNSHLPPSSDGPGASAGRRTGSGRTNSGRKRGGQKGRRGKRRELLPADEVDEFINLYPRACQGCARSLPEVPDIDARRYQQVDLVDHRRHVTEWRRHEVACPHCGTLTRRPYDESSLPRSAFGPCLTAVVALLTGAYHLSRRKTQRLLLELFGIAVSLGSVSAMEKRASDALASAHDEALREVQYARVKHSDATTWTRGGSLMSLWTLASAAATVYRIVADGCRATILPFFGPCLGFLVSDRATVFGFWAMVLRQVCWAHLLRKFVAFSERDGPAGDIGRELCQLCSLMFEYWHGFKDGLLSRDELAHWLRPVQRDIEHVLERGQHAGIDRLSGSCADMLAHRDALWTFVTEEGVEPTNNHGELELRDFVLWRKRSFGSQSERGERFAERVMTAVRTARKQGKDVLDFLVASVTAHETGAPAPRLIDAGAIVV